MTAPKADGREPEPLHLFSEELKRLGKTAFADRYGSAFLLLDSATVRANRDMAATTLEPRPDGTTQESTAPSSFEVLALRARTDDPTVRIGRDEACDVLIQDQSVSSVHAIFERRSTGAMSVRDGGSKNGTFVDERLVPRGAPEEAHVLGARHGLRFGSMSAIYLDLESFCDVARMFDPDVP